MMDSALDGSGLWISNDKECSLYFCTSWFPLHEENCANLNHLSDLVYC